MDELTIRRGDIWWCDLGPVLDSGPAGRRPVAVLSNNPLCRSALRTVVVAGLTTNVNRKALRSNVFVPADTVGLACDSVILLTNLFTADKARLTSKAGRLPKAIVSEVNRSLRHVLDLDDER
ncbi:MAG: type II toxin-antitoxin system PemK/MazF family toxin [Candidatus Dormibacteraceae bacterium]